MLEWFLLVIAFGTFGVGVTQVVRAERGVVGAKARPRRAAKARPRVVAEAPKTVLFAQRARPRLAGPADAGHGPEPGRRGRLAALQEPPPAVREPRRQPGGGASGARPHEQHHRH